MSDSDSGSDSAPLSRRRVLELCSMALGGAISVVLAVPVVRYLAHPIGKRVVDSGSVPVATVDPATLPIGGEPVQVALVAAAQRDAWAVREKVAVASAWVRRTQDGQVQALSAACPHLGCSVGYRSDKKRFECPCHKSWFGLDGTKGEGPSKRGLDPLPVREQGGAVVVSLVRYRPNIAERVEV